MRILMILFTLFSQLFGFQPVEFLACSQKLNTKIMFEYLC